MTENQKSKQKRVSSTEKEMQLLSIMTARLKEIQTKSVP